MSELDAVLRSVLAVRAVAVKLRAELVVVLRLELNSPGVYVVRPPVPFSSRPSAPGACRV